jgi:hypothetical protein
MLPLEGVGLEKVEHLRRYSKMVWVSTYDCSLRGSNKVYCFLFSNVLIMTDNHVWLSVWIHMLLYTPLTGSLRRQHCDHLISFYHERCTVHYGAKLPFTIDDLKRAYAFVLPFATMFYVMSVPVDLWCARFLAFEASFRLQVSHRIPDISLRILNQPLRAHHISNPRHRHQSRGSSTSRYTAYCIDWSRQSSDRWLP